MATKTTKPSRRTFVVGVGMTKFEKPGRKDWDYPDMAQQAGKRALKDAGLKFDVVEQAVVGYCYGMSTSGQRAVYTLGHTGIPIYNVNNNCSTGSTALFMANQLVQGGICECVMALGFEKMERGSLKAGFADRTNPLDKHMEVMAQTRGIQKGPFAPQMFGNAGREYMEKYGVTKEQLAKIAMKNHNHSANNPYSQFRDTCTLEEVLNSRTVYEPLTLLQCCPTSDGAACAIVASESFVRKHGLMGHAVEILGMGMATDYDSSFKDSCIKMVGYDMTKQAARTAYDQAGITPNDIQVIELHDCFSANELITYDALGLCELGKAGEIVERGDNTYGGKWVVNPSGGLISKGHPLGATGLAQCAEICWQLRGMAGKRQVEGAKVGLSHNVGLGGASVVTVYHLGFPNDFKPWPKDGPNPAIDEQTETKKPTAFDNITSPKQIFGVLEKRVNAGMVSRINGIFKFVIGKDGQKETWIVDLKHGDGKVYQGDEKSDVTITMAENDLVDMFKGKLNPQLAFTSGKMKIAGNLGLMMKLGELMKGQSKL